MVTDGPMQRIAMDILGPLPLTPCSNKYILVIGDYFIKWTEAFPMSDMEAGTVAKLFVYSLNAKCVYAGTDNRYTIHA